MSEPTTTKRAGWFRVSLRLLFLLMVVVGLVLAPVAARVRQASKQRIARAALDNHNWFVPLGSEIDRFSRASKSIEKPVLPAWLRGPLGEDFFTDVQYARSPSYESPSYESPGDTSPGDKDQALSRDYRYVADLHGLQKLELYRATNENLSQLQYLSKVEWLVLEQCSITDEGLRYLHRYQRLRGLTIHETPSTDDGLEYLAGLGNLSELTIRGAKIKGRGLQYITGLRQLKALSITQCQLKDDCLESLLGMSQLTTLHIESNLLTDASIDSLVKLTQLKHLTIGHTEITDAGRDRLGKALPDCYIGRHQNGR